MFLYLILYLLLFTDHNIIAASNREAKSEGTVPFYKLKQVSSASDDKIKQMSSASEENIKEDKKAVIHKSDLSSNDNLKFIENSLNLTKAIFSHQFKTSTKVQPDSTLVQPKTIQSLKLSSSAINNFADALNIYTELKNDHVKFINTINDKFNKHYPFNTSAENIMADFVGNIFKEIVQTKLKSSWFSKNLELFLDENLEKEARANYKVAESIQDTLFKIIDDLKQIKSVVLNNENKELSIKHFDQSLPIDTWIELANKLSENIKSLIPQTKDEKDEKDIEYLETLAKEFKEHQQIKSDWNKGLEDLFNQAQQEQEKILQRQKNRSLESFRRTMLEKQAELEKDQIEALAEDEKQKEAFFNKSQKIVEANTLENLNQKINENFEILKKRESEITLPKELINVNLLLNNIKTLLTDKKDNPQLKEIFTVFLSAVYQELISAEILNHPPFLLTDKKVRDSDEDLSHDSYILKEEFNKNLFYKPLYNIIMYKLNTLLLLYGIVIGDAKLKTTIDVILLFIETKKIKKYSFSTSIFKLIVLNEQAEFFNGSLLKSKADQIEFGKALSLGATYLGKKINTILDVFAQGGEEVGKAGEEVGKAGESLIKAFAAPITWINSFFEESQKAKEEARKKEEKEQKELQALVKYQNELLQSLTEMINSPEAPKSSTGLTTKDNSAPQKTSTKENPKTSISQVKPAILPDQTKPATLNSQISNDDTSTILKNFSSNTKNYKF